MLGVPVLGNNLLLCKMDVNNHVDDGSGKYEAFTLAKLREELRKRGARVSGRKAELVSRCVCLFSFTRP